MKKIARLKHAGHVLEQNLRQIEEHVHELFGLLNSKAKADQYDDSEEDRMESVDDDDGEGISTVEPDEANMDRICADQW